MPHSLSKTALLFLGLWLSVWALPGLAEVDEDELLPVDEAFQVKLKSVENGKATLGFEIADGYYLYRHAFKFSPADAGTRIGEVNIPEGHKKKDEFFGDVQTYRKQLDISVPVTVSGLAKTAAIEVKYQGCADAGVCYPPQKKTIRFPLKKADTAQKPATLPPVAVRSPLAAPGLPAGQSPFASQEGVVPEDKAFVAEAIAMDPQTLSVRFTMPEGIYLYRDKIKISSGDPAVAINQVQLPPGESLHDDHFGDVAVYYNQVEIPVQLQRQSPQATTLPLQLAFQGCVTDGICYPPMQREIPVILPAVDQTVATSNRITPAQVADNGPATGAGAVAASAEEGLSEQDSIIQNLKSRSAIYTILSFFGFGLLLALTPCVFPMIPILSGLIAGQGKISTARAFVLSLAYVIAMALTYTAAGVIAGLLGANIQAAFQKPWIIILFSLVFVALAFSMFGYYELQLPAKWQNKLSALSNRQKGGSLLGVIVMGFLSALIVGPCVAPPLAAAVLFISRSGDAFIGGLALFAMGLGMGAPLLIIGTSQGRFMPQSGGWMNVVKAFFGLLLLGMAVWFLSRILPESIVLGLWGLLLLAASILWTGYAKDSGVSATAGRVFDFLKVTLLVLGVAMLIGALMGNTDPLKPLAGLRSGPAAASGQGQPAEVHFRRIRSSDELDAILAESGKPVMLDFYADWCTECKRMEKNTFRDPKIVRALGDFVALKADVTAQNDQDKALMQRFGVIGPPATLFFDTNGRLLNRYNFFGYKSPDELLQTLQSVKQAK
jgi:thiol:disulfide interchange protein DsbD